jgi:chorismate-pyruvate lyase
MTQRYVDRRQVLLALGAAAFGAGAGADPAAARRAPGWQDGFLTRVEALALLQTFNAELLSHDSATLTLERWCGVHQLASPARLIAERVHGADKPPTGEVRAQLAVGADEPLRYRRVRLACGERVLSEADNWYVPARLTPAMNEQLDTSDTPFGRVVQPLRFQRHTLSARLLWQPLPQDWEMNAAADPGQDELHIPDHLREHRAVLSLQDGTPFSVVVETYTGQVLAFPLPQL